MQTVIKKTMEKLTAECYQNHKSAWENWENGEPVKAWWDSDGNLCVEYENGKQLGFPTGWIR